MADASPLGPGPKDVLTPQDALAQVQLQRRLALAQMLQQNAAEAGNAYGSLNGMKVVPRMGIGPAISQIANSLLGSYEQKKAIGDQQAMYQQMANRQAQAVDAAYGGGDGSSGQSFPNGVNPNLGITKQAFADWYRNNPSEAMKFAAEHQALTDQNRQYQQQGRDLNDVGALNRAADVVKGTQTFQPNTTNIVPGVSQPFVAADFANGTAGGYDNNGQPVLQGINGNNVIAQMAGAKQAATQANTILPNVTLSNGASVPMWGGQAASGMVQAPQQSGFNSDAINKHASDMVNGGYMSQDQAERWLRDQYKAAGADIGPAQTSTATGPAAPAQGQPSQPAYPSLTPIPMAPQATGIGQSTQDKALSDKRAGNIADLEQDINDKAQSAQAKLANNQKLMALVPQITKGPWAGHITEARNLLNSLGYSGADPTNNQEFEKYAMQAALESAKQVYGNRITNADLMSLPHWNPSANMTENALNSIINTDNIKQQRLLQRQNVYNDYRNKGGDLNQFNSWFNTNYPDQGIAAPSSLAPGAAAPGTQTKAVTIRVFNPKTGKLEDQ